MLEPILFPGNSLEGVAYNKLHQPSNPFLRELSARIAAVVAPIFYAYQTLVWTGITLILGLLWSVRLIDNFKKVQEVFIGAVLIAARNFSSSLLEIPQKLVFGPHNPPNYFGCNRGYR